LGGKDFCHEEKTNLNFGDCEDKDKLWLKKIKMWGRLERFSRKWGFLVFEERQIK
jgi:hypothetical protein